MNAVVWRARLRGALVELGLLADQGSWLEPQRLLACAYPRRDAALAALAARGVSVLINLHTRPHSSARLARHGLVERHLPVRDFAAPSPAQLRQGVAALVAALAEGRVVAVHCGAGLGRTGTLLACYRVERGDSPSAAVAHVRAARPGSIETAAQVAAVEAYALERANDRRIVM